MADDIVGRLQYAAWLNPSEGDTAEAHFLAADALAEIERLRALVDDFERGINWHTTCTNCAKLMDVNYADAAYCRMDDMEGLNDADEWRETLS